eukprot:CAMPEP_0170524836 /NCGR_PEP_ID=MMETSP0209-20121228/10296_1 /TAXON_ID=665100 ORGANISM="Litonotus pictus, Strain P1" /NCGR_SAMPLE_ID=MMETSP0209 /ASSEMBLY_ACC=CAM_ASM_000301 /LENGTH=226 /DNA_ID=CAMNT_0010813749 /DNA_START=258 /DNA_END=934 /DNA_ORIENTATION=-
MISAEKERFKNSTVIILGLDLLSPSLIKTILREVVSKTERFLTFFSLEKSFLNLSNEVESKKSLIKNNLEFYLLEKSRKILSKANSNSSYTDKGNTNSNSNTGQAISHTKEGLPGDVECCLLESFNFLKGTVELLVFEYKIVGDCSKDCEPVRRIEFDGVSMYKKDHKDLFEIQMNDESQQAQPSSTFNLGLTEEELSAKNKIILPYLKENNENLISVDQDDLNEL